jgi:hypothetical protein
MKVIKHMVATLGLAVASLTAMPALAAGVTGTGPLNILGKCVDAPGWNDANGTRIQIYTCNGGTNQEWTLLSDGTIRPAFNMNKCLDLPSFQTDNGTPVQIYDCNGGANQKWTLGPDQTLQGWGGKCIDDPSGQTADGTLLQYYDCNGGSNQAFALGATVSPPLVLNWNATFDNGVPVGGNVSLTIFSDGSYDFSGNFHDSGFPDYSLQLACLAKDTNGQAYSFVDSGSMHGTESIWLGGSRDHSFSSSSSSDTLKSVYWLLETEQERNGDAILCRASVNADLNALVSEAGLALGVAGVVLGIASLPASAAAPPAN